jgi:hypothetical protein
MVFATRELPALEIRLKAIPKGGREDLVRSPTNPASETLAEDAIVEGTNDAAEITDDEANPGRIPASHHHVRFSHRSNQA